MNFRQAAASGCVQWLIALGVDLNTGNLDSFHCFKWPLLLKLEGLL